MTSTTHAPEVIEGTWEEIARQADRLGGHRLRVTILPDEEQAPLTLPFAATGQYAARVRETLSQQTTPATPEEVAEAEREIQELMSSLNENRRKDGAEPLF